MGMSGKVFLIVAIRHGQTCTRLVVSPIGACLPVVIIISDVCGWGEGDWTVCSVWKLLLLYNKVQISSLLLSQLVCHSGKENCLVKRKYVNGRKQQRKH